MNLKKAYIRGLLNEGEKVIKKLEDLGGRNSQDLSGNNPNTIYFINSNGNINYAVGEVSKTALMWAGVEIFVDDNECSKPKFKIGTKVRNKANGIVMEVLRSIETTDGWAYYLDKEDMPLMENNFEPVVMPKRNDPVMVSDFPDVAWSVALYYDEGSCQFVASKNDNKYDRQFNWTFVVPIEYFDFDDLGSNADRSIC